MVVQARPAIQDATHLAVCRYRRRLVGSKHSRLDGGAFDAVSLITIKLVQACAAILPILLGEQPSLQASNALQIVYRQAINLAGSIRLGEARSRLHQT